MVYKEIKIMDNDDIDIANYGYLSEYESDYEYENDSQNDSEKQSSTVITSKHIRAINTFLLMFAGREVESLVINNKNLTRDRTELQKI